MRALPDTGSKTNGVIGAATEADTILASSPSEKNTFANSFD
jgi:hypothetical protein